MTISEDAARNELRSLLQRAKELTAQDAKIGEANVRAIFIENYLRLLGYDVLADVEREYFIRAVKEYMDFLVKVEGRPVFALEAKDLNADLSAHVTQVGNYANAEGIRWSVLTNAQEIRVYDQRLPGKPAEKLVLTIDLTRFEDDSDYDAIFKDFWRLSKDNMKTEQALKEVVGEARLDAAMRAILADPNSAAFRALRSGVRARLERKVLPEEIQMWLSTRLGTMASRGQDNAAARETSQAKPAKVKSFLASMIDRGLLNAGAVLTATYKGEQHSALVLEDGKLEVKERRYRRPSTAASAITGTSVNGWLFWTYGGKTLDELRRQP